MKISTKGRYALRVMADLAMQKKETDGYSALKDVAERQGISKKYLELIIPVLVRNGLLQANRGYLGGYRLATDADQITVGQILRLTETSMAPVSCLDAGAPACPRRAECVTLAVWRGLDRVIGNYLDGITLRDVIEGKIGERSGDGV